LVPLQALSGLATHVANDLSRRVATCRPSFTQRAGQGTTLLVPCPCRGWPRKVQRFEPMTARSRNIADRARNRPYPSVQALRLSREVPAPAVSDRTRLRRKSASFPLPFRCPGGCPKGIGSCSRLVSRSAQRRADNLGRHARGAISITSAAACQA